MSTLIVAGLMAFGLVAIIAAILLVMDEHKTSPSSTSSSNTAPEQRLPTIREEAQSTVSSMQIGEITSQLRALYEQARELEQRLSILSAISEQIERNQSSLNSEETEAAHGLINRALTPVGHDL